MSITYHKDHVSVAIEAPMLRRFPEKWKTYEVNISRKEWDMNPSRDAKIAILVHRLRNMQETEALNGDVG